ncbi:unnamed protein product, partial [Hapterophycus canaliculatus]
QAVVLVADKKFSLKVTGLGDVLAPNGGVIGELRSATQSAATRTFTHLVPVDLV